MGKVSQKLPTGPDLDPCLPHEVCPKCQSLAVQQTGYMIVDMTYRRRADGELWETEIKDHYDWTTHISCTCLDCWHEWEALPPKGRGDLVLPDADFYRLRPHGAKAVNASGSLDIKLDDLKFGGNATVWYIEGDEK